MSQDESASTVSPYEPDTYVDESGLPSYLPPYEPAEVEPPEVDDEPPTRVVLRDDAAIEPEPQGDGLGEPSATNVALAPPDIASFPPPTGQPISGSQPVTSAVQTKSEPALSFPPPAGQPIPGPPPVAPSPQPVVREVVGSSAYPPPIGQPVPSAYPPPIGQPIPGSLPPQAMAPAIVSPPGMIPYAVGPMAFIPAASSAKNFFGWLALAAGIASFVAPFGLMIASIEYSSSAWVWGVMWGVMPIVAVVLGSVAIRCANRHEADNRGSGIAGVILGGFWLVIGFIVIIVAISVAL